MIERRQFERKPYMKTINYVVTVLDFRELKNLALKGEATDISDRGIGIKTDYPLEPGHVLKFNTEMPLKLGIVRWGIILDNKYRVGIEFV